MEIDRALDFVRANHRGVLVVRRADGSPHASPVFAGVAGARIVVSSMEERAKVRLLRRDPQATYCGFEDGFLGDWVQVDGPVTIVPLPDAMEGLVDLYRAIAGEHPDWDEFRRAMEAERRVLISITPERIVFGAS